MVCGCLYIYDKFTKHDRFTKHDKYTNEADAMIYTEDHITSVAAAEYNVSEFCVVIDAGHGGSDEGTAGGEVVEKDINFSVAMKLKAVLEDNKIQVVLTRSSDENISLTRRTLAANKSSADFFISLHCNYYEEDVQIAGLECYYSSREAGESRAYAKSIIHAVSISDDIRAGDAKTGDYYVLRYTRVPAVLVDMGFLSNDSERQKLSGDDYQEILSQKIAEGIFNGIKGGKNP